MDELTVPERRAPVVLDRDIAVCGAGSAGLGAALAAARAGASVALVERWPFFGGNATAASLGSICGLFVNRDGGHEYLSGGIAREWAQALVAQGNAMGPLPYKETAVLLYSPWGYKRLADELVRAEANITPLLHSFISGVIRSGDEIEAIVLATKKGPMAVRARVFVDATGDADVVFHAGCPWEMGEPGRLQYPSMQFYMQNVDMQKAWAAGLDALNTKIQQARSDGSYTLTRSAGAVIPTMRTGEVVGAMTRVARSDGTPIDGTDPFDLTFGEMTGRDIAEESARFLRAEMPGFEDSFLGETAVTLGIRETRHALGDHVLTLDEAAACTKFADGVAASSWPFEFHTEGSDTRWEFIPPGEWFEIPYRSLLVREASNLLVAGRCISATHEALASSRVTGVCMAIGEAAGRAAARCVAKHIGLRELDAEELHYELVTAGTLPGSPS